MRLLLLVLAQTTPDLPAPPPPPPVPAAQNPDQAVQAGRKALGRGDAKAAESAFQSAVQAAPERADAWAGLGSAQIQQERYSDAETSLKKALELDPALDDARYNLAYVQRARGNPETAATSYAAYLERVPDDADAWYAYGETLESLGRKLEAADAFDRYATAETRPAREPWVERARHRADNLRAEAGAGASAAAAGIPTAGTPAPTPTPSGPMGPVFEALEAQDYALALERLKTTAPEPGTGIQHAAYASAHLGLGQAGLAERYYRRALEQLKGPAALAARFGLAEALRLQEKAEARTHYQQVADSEDSTWAPLARKQL